jgi:signal transduction histidine kinase/sugar lactone lactonase YvrE
MEEKGLTPEDIYKRKEGNFYWKAFSKSIFLKNGEPVFETDDQINDGYVDREGNFWIATYSKGLYQIRKNFFKTYSIEEGLISRNVYPVSQTSDGTIWLGTYLGGITSIRGGKVTSGYLIQGKSNREIFIQSILERSNGDLLVVDLGGAIYRYTGERIFMKYADTDFGRVNQLFEDSKGTLWLATISGLYYQKGNEWVHVDEPRMANSAIKVIQEAPDGTFWIGTSGQGVFHFNGATAERLIKEDGLSSNIIRSIWIDVSERNFDYEAIIGTEDQGLTRIPVASGRALKDELVTITEENGLYDNTIHKIIPDDQGRVWMSSNRGLFWVYRFELEQFEKGAVTSITSTGYTEKDGLKNREANGGIQPAGIKAADGTIWFPTQDGVVMVDPFMIKRNTNPPPVVIEEMNSREMSFSTVPEEIQLELDDRDLSFSFTALSFVSPEKNRFRYRLFGYDDNWNDTQSDRSIRYTNLPPGEYTFKVIASNNDGIWNQQGDTVAISIPAHFYEEWWFYALLVILALTQIVIFFLIMRAKAMNSLEAKELEVSEINKRMQELESRISNQKQIKQTLLFNLKAELREPVVSLRKKVEEGKESTEKVVERETHKMLSTIDQLLLLSEIEVEGISLNPSLENLVEVVKTSIGIHKHEAMEGDPVIELSSNTDQVQIYLDIRFAIIIFRNLIKSATEHIGVNKVRVQVVEESSYCTVKITDDGDPLTHEELHNIFTLFKNYRQTKEQRNELGIDLPLVARLVELHKASIVVHSIPETGNTYIVTFKKGILHLEK